MKDDLSYLSYHWRKQLVWGMLFIGFGTLVLLDRYGLLDFDLDLSANQLWHYWPLLLVISGINKMIAPTTARRFMRGLWHIFFAAWWYVSFEHLWGLSFQDSWPALLIAWGLKIVLRPLVQQRFISNKEY